MKLSLSKPALKTLALKKPAKAVQPTIEDLESKVSELCGTVADLELRLASLAKDAEVEATKGVQRALVKGSDYLARMECDIGHRVAEFFKLAPVWEIASIRRDLNPLGAEQEIRALYKKGYCYLGTVFDKFAKLELYHRPRMPDTKEEFLEMYKGFFKQLERDANLKDSSPNTEPHQILTVPAKKVGVVKLQKKR